MKFGPTPLEEARGAVLAHTIRLPGRVIKKGSVLQEGELQVLREAQIREVIAATMQPGDVPEDEAAERLAQALMSPLLRRWLPDDPSYCMPRLVGEGERAAEVAPASEAAYAGLKRDWTKL